MALMNQNSKYIFTPLLSPLLPVGYLAKDAESLSYKLPVLSRPCFRNHWVSSQTLHFASHISGFILCAARYREMSSGILNGPTCIIPVKIKRKAAESILNLFLLMCHTHTNTSAHPLCLVQIQEHHVYRSA